jgi:hypothetical protein
MLLRRMRNALRRWNVQDKGGRIVGPIEAHDMHIWKYTWQGAYGVYHYWTEEGYHELSHPDSNLPEMDIVGPSDEEINYEEIVG